LFHDTTAPEAQSQLQPNFLPWMHLQHSPGTISQRKEETV
jgi:hypothetical protein